MREKSLDTAYDTCELLPSTQLWFRKHSFF